MKEIKRIKMHNDIPHVYMKILLLLNSFNEILIKIEKH